MRRPPLLDIEAEPAGPAALRFTARSGRAGDLGPLGWRAVHPIDPAAVAREIDALRAARHRAVLAGSAPAEEALRAHGALLFDLLLPAPLKAALRDAGDRGDAALVAGPAGFDVPWPLLHDGRGFLGRRLALGCASRGPDWPADAADDRPLRVLVIADPAADLPATRAEGEALAAVFAEAPRLPGYDLRLGGMGRSEVLRALRRYTAVHFAGHVDPDGWRLADGPLDAAAIDALRGGPVPRLVFANACRSLGPAADALLAAGVRHLVGTDLDLPDLAGADFARDVYRALTAGAAIGEALRRARARAAERGDPAWTAYALRGDPRTAYAEAEAEAEAPPAELRRAVALAVRRPPPEAELWARAEATHRWRRRVEAAVVSAGGTMLPSSGLVCRAVFGVPIRREDDVRRAAAAALALCAAAPDAVVGLDAGRLAVAGGEVLGAPLDRVEARCWQAGPGVHVGPAVAEALRGVGRFAADAAERLVSIARPGVPAGPFIGRRAELDHVDRMAEDALAGGGLALTVVGPAGIGKSRFVDALRGRLAERFAVHAATADTDGPYAGVAEWARALCGLAPDVPPEAARRRLRAALEHAPGDDVLSIDALLGDGGEIRDRHAETLGAMLGLDAATLVRVPTVAPAVRALIEAAARRGPLALLIDDARLAPPPAMAVLEALLDDPPPALIVLATRPGTPLAERPAGPRRRRLDLGPLPERAARALVAALRPEASADETARLLARAEGNPLFLHELSRAPAADGEALPETVEALIQARLDRLAADDRLVLRAAAVLGRTFWREGLERLLGHAVPDAALARLAAARFVLAEPESDLAGLSQWRFEHGLVHAVVERSIPHHAEAALHGRAALWLADEVPGPSAPRAARIARHREAAGDLRRAVADWIAAADHAEATLANEAAREALAAALALADRVALPAAERAALDARLGELDRLAGDFERAAARFSAALEHGPADAADRAWRLGRLSMTDLARGRVDAAQAAADAALALVDAAEVPAGVRAEITHHAAWLDYHRGDLDRAEARLVALLDDLPAAETRGRGMAWHLLGTIAQQRGDVDRAAVWLRRALGAVREDLERVRVLHGLALVAVQRGAFDDAERSYAESIRIRARRGDRAGLAKTYNNLGTLCGERGDAARAERYLREAIRIRRRIGHASLVISHANLVELYLRGGRQAEARAELAEVTALLDAGEAPSWARSELWRMTAEVRLGQGELDGAAEAAERAIAVARAMRDRPREAGGLEIRARVARARGEPARAIADLEAAVAIHEALEHAAPLADALGALAELVEPDDPARAARLRRARSALRPAASA